MSKKIKIDKEQGEAVYREDVIHKLARPEGKVTPDHVVELYHALGFASTAWDKDGVFMSESVIRQAENVDRLYTEYFEKKYDSILESQYVKRSDHEAVVKEILEQGVSINYKTLKAHDLALMIFAWSCKQKGASEEQFMEGLHRFSNGRSVDEARLDATFQKLDDGYIVRGGVAIHMTDQPKQPEGGTQ